MVDNDRHCGERHCCFVPSVPYCDDNFEYYVVLHNNNNNNIMTVNITKMFAAMSQYKNPKIDPSLN